VQATSHNAQNQKGALSDFLLKMEIEHSDNSDEDLYNNFPFTLYVRTRRIIAGYLQTYIKCNTFSQLGIYNVITY
jgi:hypothetical protein